MTTNKRNEDFEDLKSEVMSLVALVANYELRAKLAQAIGRLLAKIEGEAEQ